MIGNIDHLPSQFSPGTAAVRRAWQTPRLNALGDVCGLTESGSKPGIERGPLTGEAWTCGLPDWLNSNMQFNMC